MERVVDHNGGRAEIVKVEDDATFIRVLKA